MRHNLEQRITYALKIQDGDIHKRIMLEKFSQLTAEELSEALHFILHEAARGRKDFQNILPAISDLDPLVADKGYDFISQVCYLASLSGYENVTRFLCRPRRQQVPKLDFPADSDQLAHEMTLGERKALAMSPARATLDRLLFDPEPMVIEKLLKNPRLTLEMVVRIAARRPNRPSILRTVFHSSRWSPQYEVKLALARNPYTSPEITFRLLPALHSQDLRDVAADTSLMPEIRDAARKMSIERKDHESKH
ncbi:MAG: hypothetical protein JXQ27_03480 [Acidobacteria bacterium]|nr:hypothetical protein [Acidobacteriota bacterium]